MTEIRTDRLVAFVKGVALGDSLGMLAENLPRRKLARMYPDGVSQKMPLGRGFLSDETEQTLLTARALVRTSRHLPPRISFRRELLWWLTTFPIGAGSSTVKACISIAFMSRIRLASSLMPGVPSKGNGPLMRAATIGLLLDTDQIDQASAWTTLLTHTSLESVTCSVIVARIFSRIGTSETADVPINVDMFRDAAHFAEVSLQVAHGDYGWHREIRPYIAGMEKAFAIIERVTSGTISMGDGLEALGCGEGVSGHVTQTLLASLLIAAVHQGDVNGAADTAILAGGDTDSVAALSCGLVAAATSSPQDYSRLKLWRDPYGLTAISPPSGQELLHAISTRRHRMGMLAEHLSLMFLAAPAFLGRRAIARWGQ